MYLRGVHAETSIPALRQFIQENNLGILTTAINSPLYNFIQSTHIPWVIDVKDPSSESELPVLRGHLARQNPHAKAFIDHVKRDAEQPPEGAQRLQCEVMVLFNGPSHHYVTPKFYTKTKPGSGKVVPTWNYAAAQCYGNATVYVDTKSEESAAFLSKQIRDLSHMAETKIMGYEKPWAVDDAPEKFIDMLRKAIIGIEIEVTSLDGKFKMSQEMGKEDRDGVADGMAALNSDDADYVARTVRDRGGMKDGVKTS